MNTYIALFRGINVGGKNILPMKNLVVLLQGLGARCVDTYIQSGNAVFQHEGKSSAGLADKIGVSIKETCGFEAQAIVLERTDLEKAIAANPFPEAEAEPKSLHLYFMAEVPRSPDIERLESIKSDRERFSLGGKVFYLHAPDGIGRSRLAARAEQALGVPATARNWRTACKLVVMAKECG